jgi:ABC-2 type transport system ATP-binding protein
LAAGLSRPTTGSVLVFGQEVRPNGTAHLGKLGYFDQLRPLYGSLRVEEMLTVGRRLNPAWDDAAADAWLTDLAIPRRQKVGKLSLGQQAQVALTVCMAKRPDLLLLDEPVASLDPLARRQLLEILMGTVAERGTTVFLSSHIVSELEPLCDNLIILSASQVQITGSIDSLLADHRILIGPRDGPRPTGVEVVSSRETGRQASLLVRGEPEGRLSDWREAAPSLDEIVLAYLARPLHEYDERAVPKVAHEGDEQ